MTVAPALMIAGGVLSAVGAVQQGMAASAAANYNAKIARQNAEITRQQGKVSEDRQRRQSSKLAGENRAAIGASGVAYEGSVLDLMASNAYDAEMDAQTVRYNSELEARNYESEAKLQRMRGRSARVAGFIGGASSLLSAGGTYYEKYGQPVT